MYVPLTVSGSLPFTRYPLLTAVTVTGTFCSLIMTLMLCEEVALEARNENSDLGGTSLLLLSIENGAGVYAEKMTWLHGSVLLELGLASYAQTLPAMPETAAATTSERIVRKLTILFLSV